VTNPPPNRIFAQGLRKQFPGVLALDNVSLAVRPSEVLAVVGENGAGKSTLMRILAGNQRPDAGRIEVDGKAVDFYSPADAMKHGISLIHQELNLADNLTVAENIFLGREPNRFGWVNRKEMQRMAAEYLSKVGLEIAPPTALKNLSVAQKQMVEIAKALSTQATVLVMDEPTSSLSHQETEKLFTLVDELRLSGVSIVYISHRLGEVLRLADRVEVLRDGKNAGSLEGKAIEHDAMVHLMIGRDPKPLDKPKSSKSAGPRLKVDNLSVDISSEGCPRSPVSLTVHGGEIVVLAGLVGAGRSELLETIFGIRESAGGSVWVDEKMIANRLRDTIDAGIALVTEDRKATGLLVESSVRVNSTITALCSIPSFPFIRTRWEEERTAAQIESLGIKTATQHTTVSMLSGGNQQKIAIAKWLIRSPRVLLLDEPTRGVDIAARQEIYNILLKLATENVAILIASSDMEEVIAIADRVLVMHEGRLMGDLIGEMITESNIMQLAVGQPLLAATR
jgi:ribose transport system ATP-binding protein